MIPIELRLSNFLCYRDPEPLDFRGIHLACLTGDNGHGKSALLDAITWALWGKARDGKRSADELIHLGETDMDVQLEFSLESQRFRVLRKRSSRGRGRSILELQISDGDGFRPLTDPTIRETQARIDRLLHMDYETFINSAFLLQGRADEFTVKTASERKRILGEILDLSIYDEYEEQAKMLARTEQAEAEQLTAQVTEMDLELAHRANYEAESAKAGEDVARTSEARQTTEQELRALHERRRDLLAKAVQIAELATRIAQGEGELAALDKQARGSEAQIEQCRATLDEAPRIERGYSGLQTARENRDRLDQKLTSLLGLREKERQLQETIGQAKNELLVLQQVTRESIADMEATMGKAPTLQAEREKTQGQLAALTEVEKERQKAQDRLRELAAETAILYTQNGQLKAGMEPLQEKIALLKTAEEAVCPLCNQWLSEAQQSEMVAQLSAEGKDKGDQHRANTIVLGDLAKEQDWLTEKMGKLEQELRHQPHLQGLEATLSQQLAEAQAAADKRVVQEFVLAAVRKRLETQDYAHEEQATFSELVAEMEALGYDGAAHERVRAAAIHLAKFEQRHHELATAQERLEEELAGLRLLEESRLRWLATLTKDRKRHSILVTEIVTLPEVASQVNGLESIMAGLVANERMARDGLAAARQKLAYCEQLAQRRKEWLKRERAAREAQSIYEELRTAFGKQGIQAMIIESAIPEIEDEANALLARMTNGRMHVRFETQREKKSEKGEFIETLDISISDEAGIRNYNMYSGGEAFRINFAIRIALSKLLARRAGARLQTLVMDEGFGTQDAEGRTRLVEAINAIKDDFARVLVITHIEELKDSFPVRIDVRKTPEGSKVTIH